MRRSFVTGVLVLLSAVPLFAARTSYEYYAVGNQNDVTTATTAGTVLMGGGSDVDAAFQWTKKAPVGGTSAGLAVLGSSSTPGSIY